MVLYMITTLSGFEDSRVSEQVVRSDVSEGGGGSHSLASPSFLLNNMDNVNGRLYWAQSLLAVWHFKVYKGRIGRTHVILNKRDEPSVLKIMPAACGNRCFNHGRLYIASRARQYRHYTGYIQPCLTWAARGRSGEV